MADYAIAKTLDYKGLACPMPVVKISQQIGTVSVGEVIEVHTTDPAPWRTSRRGRKRWGTPSWKQSRSPASSRSS